MLHDDWIERSVALHPVIERLLWVIYIKLCIGGMVPTRWNEGTEPVTEFTVDAECWRSSPTFVDPAVYLNPK